MPALDTVNVAMGFEAGLVVVVLAITLDCICKRPAPRGRGRRREDEFVRTARWVSSP